MIDSQVREPFAARRLGTLMEPNLDHPFEAGGILNPAAVRGPDGDLYLFPRLVARGNYSRIGIARVLFDDDGDPRGVERLGIALEPSEPYEKNPISGGGCEDPRIVYFEPLQRYVMTYTAFSAQGARIALAISKDLFNWERLGLVRFGEGKPFDFNTVDNKDALLFPSIIPNPQGLPSIGVIHRPLFPGTHPHQLIKRYEEKQHRPAEGPPAVGPAMPGEEQAPEERGRRLHHESLWVSYCHEPTDARQFSELQTHHRLMSPRASWERIKVGGGVPPILTRHGWLVIYHGVSAQIDRATNQQKLRYCAGALVLDTRSPEVIRYRSRHPILAPDENESQGVVPNVVFPTGADCRADLGQPERIDIYYGMADSRIGVATLNVPVSLPQQEERPEDRRDARGEAA